ESGAEALADRIRLARRGDDAVGAGFSGEFGAPEDEILKLHVDAAFRKAFLRQAGEHRNAENFQALVVAAAGDGALQNIGLGVNSEKVAAELCDAPNAALDRCADIVKLEIEKNFLSGAAQFFRQIDAADRHQLITDLV